MKKAILIIVIFAILVLVGLFVLGKFGNENGGEVIQEESQVDETPTTSEDVVVRPQKVRKELPPEFADDKDRDGLSEEEESSYGTSDLESDTDGDGIADGTEVNRWGTDPTNVDTDGDGFTDMIEILGGFNPNGEGKL